MGDYQFTRRKDDDLARCDTCRSLIFVGDEEAHAAWHETLGKEVRLSGLGFGKPFGGGI